MSIRKQSITGLCVLALIACGSGGSVARFAPCSSGDTCPSATVCEAITTSNGSKSINVGPSFCTWSCTDDELDEQKCPNDAHGVQGTCVSGLEGVALGNAYAYGFCFQDCELGGACPDGESCQPAETFRGAATMVCVPTPNDSLGGTSWTSTTIAPIAVSDAVTSSSYTMTFGATSGAISGLASGAFSATLIEHIAGTAIQYAGCTQTTTFTGGTWVDLPPTQTTEGVFTVSNTNGTTSRTGCKSSFDDEVSESSILDVDTSDNGAPYTLSESTMTLPSGQNGAVPYTDDVPWTFTKN